jgi:hypothetical protein
MQGIDEVAEHFHRQHDGIAAPPDVFGDLDDASAVVFFQVEKENFPICDQFFGVQWWLMIAPKSAAAAPAASAETAAPAAASPVASSLIAILAVATACVFIVIKRHVSVLLLVVIMNRKHFRPAWPSVNTEDSRKSSGYPSRRRILILGYGAGGRRGGADDDAIRLIAG